MYYCWKLFFPLAWNSWFSSEWWVGLYGTGFIPGFDHLNCLITVAWLAEYFEHVHVQLYSTCSVIWFINENTFFFPSWLWVNLIWNIKFVSIYHPWLQNVSECSCDIWTYTFKTVYKVCGSRCGLNDLWESLKIFSFFSSWSSYVNFMFDLPPPIK